MDQQDKNKSAYRSLRQSGNMFFALFGAVGLVGVIGATAMTVMKGPVRSMHNVTQKTIAENNMIAAGKLSLMAASSQSNDGDCDMDSTVEPIPFDAAGVGPKPVGGGYLPNAIGAAKQDPWGTTYGYCAWDHGPIIKNGTCPDDAGRLTGQADKSGTVLAIISAGPDRAFQTTCGNSPAYVVRNSGSDDIVLDYSYDEATAMAAGLWTIKNSDPNTAEINKNLEVKDGSGTVVFGVDSTSNPLKPSIKTDFISQLTQGSVEFLSNIKLGNSWLSGDGGNEGIKVSATGDVGIGAAANAGLRLDVNGPMRVNQSATYDVWLQGGTSTASNAARNLALLGVTGSDTLYLNHASEYTGGVIIGGPTTNTGNLTVSTGNMTVSTGNLTVGANITSTGRYYYFGPTQYIYGDNSSALYYNSNHATISQMIFRDSANNIYGRVYGTATDFGIMDGDSQWAIRAIKDASTIFYINNTAEMRLYPTYLDMLGNRIANVGAPTSAGDATSKTYVDNAISTTAGNYLPLAGGTMTGTLNLGGQAMSSSAGTIRDGGGGWVRTYNATGWYNGTYGGGMYMADSTYVRTYNGKHLLVDASVRSPIFYDSDNTGYYLDAAGVSRLNDIRPNIIYDGQNTGYYWDGNGTTSMNVVYGAAYYYQSDERLKKNIATLGAGRVDDLYKLRGVTFNWKETDQSDIGFIAQEVEQVYPELVDENDAGIKGVKYGNVVALLVEAAKSQKSEIDSLKSQMALMKDSVGTTGAVQHPAATSPTVTSVNAAQPSMPKINVAALPYAEDISVCVKPDVPACVDGDMADSIKRIDCNTELTSYIFSAKLYGLCVRGDQSAHSSFSAEYDAALAKVKNILFDEGDVSLNNVMATHVIALNNVLDGNAVLPPYVEPEPTVPAPPPIAASDADGVPVVSEEPAAPLVEVPVVSSADRLGINNDMPIPEATAVVTPETVAPPVVQKTVSETVPEAPSATTPVMAQAPASDHNHMLIYLLIVLNFMFSLGLLVALKRRD